ncbi:MAG: cystathionine beta-lyase [Pseudomonadota bacterium]
MSKKTGEETRLIHSDYAPPEGFSGLSTPVHHASTVLFNDVHAYRNRREQLYDGYIYGLTGTPTTMALAQRIADLEGGHRAALTPSGLSAITLVYLACLKQGDHVLVPDNVYAPSRDLCTNLLANFGIESTFYDPLLGEEISALIRDNTRLIWLESPGSVTMEVQDVPAIARAARAKNVLVAIDNTWSAGLYFKPFIHGCDISIQAVTKYIGGHADLLLGAITTKDETLYRRLKDMADMLGLNVAADDCFLALRGLPTLGARLRQHQTSALAIANWLKMRPEIKWVLHPAISDCPGHDIWQRDFNGSSGLFSVIMQKQYSEAAIDEMINRLRYFKIGASWGGPVSLALPLDPHSIRTAVPWQENGQLVRFSIGLEDPTDLIADLESSLTLL